MVRDYPQVTPAASVRSVRQRTYDEEIFAAQAALWRAYNPRATAEQEAAAMERIRAELEG